MAVKYGSASFYKVIGENLPGNSNRLTYPDLKSLPKIDLHRHLEGSLRLNTLAEIAREHRLDLPGHDIDSLRPFVQVTDDHPGFNNFLAKFKVLRSFYRSPETVSRLAYEAVADAAADNVRYLELRFSPQALARVRGFAYSEVMDWVIEATKKASEDYNIQVGLIVTLVRHDPLKSAQKVAEVAFERHNRGVVGLDLAGDEVNFPMSPFRELFIEAKQLGMGTTVHAGEWSGADTVEEAILGLGADRLGHGVRAVENSRTIRLVRQRSITLEICLTSNIQTGVVHDIGHHPLIDLLGLDVLATLNTDDPRVSNSSLTDEFQVAIDKLNLGYQELRQLTLNAASAAFLPDEKREQLIAYFETQLPGDRFP